MKNLKNKKTKKTKIVSVKNLSVNFERGNKLFKAVDDISFNINEGEVFGLIGESGSGKTTIGRAMVGLVDHSNGIVKIDNILIPSKVNKIGNRNRKKIAEKVQMIFQNPKSSLNPIHNIEKIISEGLMNFNYFKSDIKIETKQLENKLEILKNNIKIFENRDITLMQLNNKEYKNEKKELERNTLNIHLSDNFLEIVEKRDELLDKKRWLIKKIKRINLNTSNLVKMSVKEYNTLKFTEEERIENKIKIIKDLWTDEKKEIRALTNDKKDYKIYNLRKKSRILKNEITNSLEELNEYIEENNLKDFLNKNKIWGNLERAKKTNLISEKFYEVDNIINFLTYNSKIEKSTITNWVVNSKEFLAIYNNPKYKLNTNSSKNLKNIFKEDYKKEIDILKKKIENINNFISDNERGLGKLSFEQKLEYNEKKIISIFEREVYKEIILIQDVINKKFLYLLNFRNYIFKKDIYTYLISSYYYLKKISLSVFEEQKKSKKIELKEIEKKLVKSHSIELTKILKKISDYNKRIDRLKSNIILTKQENQKKSELINNFESKWNKKASDVFKVNFNITIDKLNEQKEVLIEEIKKRKKKFIWESYRLERKLSKLDNDVAKKSNELEKLRANGLSESVKFNEISVLMMETEKQIKDVNNQLKEIAKKYPLSDIKELVREEVIEMLNLVGLNHTHLSRFPEQFSGGQQQRIGIARALITKPKLIIADEPISALDISIQAQIINLLKELKDKLDLTILFIAHDLRMVQYISDRIAVIFHGKIIEIGTADEIIDHPIHPYTKSLISSIPTIDKSKKRFELNSFDYNDLNYDQFKKPEWQKINENHSVLSTKNELLEWTKK